ncbi:hypothetical protein N0V83_007918 [Neocucurbitaria cava]|uniref:Siderophore iron transporter mirA n=1 Tax=Neocucurbitaria cava TaxID=798079 RepID=A0A9W8Y377_9PLEO|nr:hypothetical protein N0V83_007918 [Neocucurbitaria cava]
MTAKPQNNDDPVVSVVEERPGLATDALRTLWTPRALGCAIGCLLVMNFFMNMTVYTQNVYEPYATSHFDGHSLLSTGSIINGIVRIVAYPLLAKLADLTNHQAGGIFDSLGDTWWNITQQIFVADVTSLVNRGILFTLPESLSAIPTLYGGSYLGEHMLLSSTWRWGYGMWAIILPVTAIPTISIMLWMGRRAKRMGLIRERLSLMHGAPSGALSRTYHIVTQLDIIGAFLLIGGLAMTLLPMTIAGRNNTDRWERPSSIILLVVGVLTFIAFLVWDGKFAPNPIVPYRTIKERNVIVACVSVIFIAASDSVYRPFLSSFLQVAGHYSPGAATRVDNAQRVAFNIGALVSGICLKYVKQTKPIIMLGVGLIVLASGLPIYLTNISGTHIANEAAFITSKSILGVGRGFAQVSLQVSLQAVLESDQIAVATAVYLSSIGFGSNLGVTISGAMWNSLLLRRLNNYFSKTESQRIFGSIVVAKKYKVGSIERVAIDKCYRETQQSLAIGSVCVSSVLLVLVFFARNIKLREEDTKRELRAEKVVDSIKLEETKPNAPYG